MSTPLVTPTGSVQQIAIARIQIPRERRELRGVESLAQSIRLVGLLQPIVVTTDLRLVAGYHRLRACELLGWTEILAVIVSLADLDAELAEIDENLIRNELTQLERSEQLLRRKEIYEAKFPQAPKGPGRRRTNAETVSAFSTDTATKTGLTDRTVRHDVQIATKISQPIRDQLRDTPIADSKRDLLKLARMQPDEQERAVAFIAAGQAKDVRTARNLSVATAIVAEPLPPPIGPYRVLVADPPWAYQAHKDDISHRAGLPYPDMPTDQICALPVGGMAHDDCILWLWTTNAFMRDAYRCLDAWGFADKTIVTWVKRSDGGKIQLGTGDWLRNATEHCILAVRGRPTVLLEGQHTVLEAPRREHSRKPDEFYALVEGLCPGSKLELFAREARPGWAAWGAEVDRFSNVEGGGHVC